jgi:hypothetical protein
MERTCRDRTRDYRYRRIQKVGDGGGGGDGEAADARPVLVLLSKYEV